MSHLPTAAVFFEFTINGDSSRDLAAYDKRRTVLGIGTYLTEAEAREAAYDYTRRYGEAAVEIIKFTRTVLDSEPESWKDSGL